MTSPSRDELAELIGTLLTVLRIEYGGDNGMPPALREVCDEVRRIVFPDAVVAP